VWIERLDVHLRADGGDLAELGVFAFRDDDLESVAFHAVELEPRFRKVQVVKAFAAGWAASSPRRRRPLRERRRRAFLDGA